MDRLDESVRRQLAWKYEVGLFKEKITSIDQIDTIVSGPETTKLTDEIATRALTLVKNGSGTIPLDKTKRIAVLGISNGFDGPLTMASLNGSLRAAGVGFTPAYIQENSTPEQIEAARQAVSGADVVVVGLYGRVRSGARNSVGIPDGGGAILRGLIAARKTVIGVSFGNPYVLGSFPEMDTYLVAYGDMPSLQRAAGRGLTGQQDITGRLPITLPGLFPRGTGVQIMKK